MDTHSTDNFVFDIHYTNYKLNEFITNKLEAIIKDLVH